MSRNQWQAAGILVLVFALGAATGVGLLAAWHGKQRQRVARFGFGPPAERPVFAMMRRLDLSGAQHRSIEEIVERHAPARRAILQDMMGQCGQELAREKANMDSEIRAILTPEQRSRFDELAKHQGDHWFGPGLRQRPHLGRARFATDDAGTPIAPH